MAQYFSSCRSLAFFALRNNRGVLDRWGHRTDLQSIAEGITTLDVNRWVLMLVVNLYLLVARFFLPPVAVIVMAAPILLPIVITAGFDPYWFAVVLTINMEIGLISPPVGLNL